MLQVIPRTAEDFKKLAHQNAQAYMIRVRDIMAMNQALDETLGLEKAEEVRRRRDEILEAQLDNSGYQYPERRINFETP